MIFQRRIKLLIVFNSLTLEVFSPSINYYKYIDKLMKKD